ncbi:unnamed protein product [Symbiodinium sp. CCMP2456]|nr:unnamed protein product [Symbiodinium sp. CCMP2456]
MQQSLARTYNQLQYFKVQSLRGPTVLICVLANRKSRLVGSGAKFEARAGLGAPWRTSPTPTRRHARSSAGSGRRSARAACRRSAERCASARSEEATKGQW